MLMMVMVVGLHVVMVPKAAVVPGMLVGRAVMRAKGNCTRHADARSPAPTRRTHGKRWRQSSSEPSYLCQ